PLAIAAQAKPEFDRAALHPPDAADSCSTKTRRKRLRKLGPAPPSSDRCVREATAFQLFHSFFDSECLTMLNTITLRIPPSEERQRMRSGGTFAHAHPRRRSTQDRQARCA